ncbi:MAG: histidine phosphatase family protein, partial [Bradyrhizobium sp.]
MRRLMLLRHAKTETDAPTGRDQDRRLDERGHQDAAMIG